MTEDLVTKIIGKLSEEILSKNHKDDIAAELKTYLDSFDNQTDEKRKALEAQLKAIADGLTGKHKDLIGSAVSNFIDGFGCQIRIQELFFWVSLVFKTSCLC